MKWVVIIARTLLGLAFLVIGLDHFFKFLKMPTPDLPDHAIAFGTALGQSGYMNVIKVLEISGGLLLLTGRFAPVGLTILTPIIVNIVLFEVFLAKQPGLGIALLAIAVFLIAGYWRHFRSVFTPICKMS